MDIAILFRNIIYLKEFIITTLVLSLLLVGYLSFCVKYLSKSKKNRILYLFFQMDRKSMVATIFLFLYFTFYISCMIRFQPLMMVHIYLFVLFTVIILILHREVKWMITILLNHLLQFAALMVLNLIVNYVLNVRMNLSFLLIYIGSAIAMLMYSTYLLLYEMKWVSKGRINNEK